MKRLDYAPRLSSDDDGTVRGLLAAWLRAAPPFDATFYSSYRGHVRDAADRLAGFYATRERYFEKRGGAK